ncbi:MAG TPA: heliorhodopsin HeR [Acidimicrobiia bacterium]|nr:heliorhodopsin HeR [Acidimicrobiia bacterium]
MTSTVEPKLVKLRRFNVIMGFFHLVQGILMLVLSSDFALPVTSAFQVFDEESNRLVSDFKTAFDLPIGPVVAAFLLLSAVAHFAIASPGIYRWYSNNLLKGANYARWIEYSLSSSLMIVVVSMLVGIFDIVALISIFAVNAMMILFGWMMELHNQTTKKTDWTSYWFGSIAGIVPWIGIAIYLIGAGQGEQGPPGFVYAIFFSIFLFFNVFAINMVLQYRKVGKWSDYLYGERAYILLSLFAKTALAWQVFAGTLRPV